MSRRLDPKPTGNLLVLVGFIALCGLSWLLVGSVNDVAALLH